MTYTEIKEFMADWGATNSDLPIFVTTDNNENAVLGIGGRDNYGNPIYVMNVMQSNNWIRVNTYWENGTIEETYRR